LCLWGDVVTTPHVFHLQRGGDAIAQRILSRLPSQPARPNEACATLCGEGWLDRAFLNESIDEFVTSASQRNIPITLMNHPTGEHGFDILNNDARTHAIIKATLAFLHDHLQG
jgi:hypothetical protein